MTHKIREIIADDQNGTHTKERKLKQTFLISLALLALPGCNTPPVQIISYEDQPIKHIGNHGVSIEEIQIDIRMAATKAGWNIIPGESPQRMRATRIDGKTSATVEIAFNSTHYSIKYKDSTGLEYLNGCTSKTPNGPIKINGKCISPTYNEWVTELNSEISRRAQY
ncbi:MAG: hypothetical protein HY799_11165 [Nitrosomonadales bacterium]|nr:hypothetical protein [Nitrosomonadales bacterium]